MTDAVVVTGIGAVSALGTGIEAHRLALHGGKDGFRKVQRFEAPQARAQLAATWPGWDGRVQPEPSPERDLAATAEAFPLHEMALVAAREAWAEAGSPADPARSGLVFGTCFGHGFKEFHAVADRIAGGLRLAGPRATISTACASSTHAIGLARDMLVRGHADAVVAGGADALLREAFAGFSALGVLSAEPCAPFSEPEGTTLGEGAGFLVLERAGDAARRGARVWATIDGYGLAADGFHETTPDPSGAGVERAILGALADAGWGRDRVDFVSAHATGTSSNDRIEWAAIERQLGASGTLPAVSGSKSQLGHTQGAAGALELILALVCLGEGTVPPTLHFRGPRTGCPRDPIADAVPRVRPVARALKLSAAFGGVNAALAYSGGAGAPREPRTRAHVWVSGVGVVGPAGTLRRPTVQDLTRRRGVGRCHDLDLHGIGLDPRGLDRSARLLTAAASLALDDASARGERRAGMEYTGLFVGATRMPEESSRRCRESIRQRGAAGASASAFARMSVNAPAGACSRALGLLGPTTTVTMGDGSGLLALLLAVEWLALRDDADCIVAGGVDEHDGSASEQAEGAACLALRRGQAPAGATVAAGWGIAGSTDCASAVRRAMGERSDVDAILVDGGGAAIADAIGRWVRRDASVDVVDVERIWGSAQASRSCVMAALGSAYLAAGEARSVLLVSAGGGSAVALRLERGVA
jgi:3-oxoacyl-[acyl-carrier-protein] synthase II